MKASLNFRLPEDSAEFNAAVSGQRAISALWEIDQFLRSKIKHGNLGDEADILASETRTLIPSDLLEEPWI